MQIHDLQRRTPNKSSRQVGRGGKRGKTSGRGHKGQKARAGHSLRPEIRDQIKKIPKLRGYRFASIQIKPSIVNLALIEKNFGEGDVVSPTTLLEKKLIKRSKGVLPKVKILGTGDFTKKVTFENVEFSLKAGEKTGQTKEVSKDKKKSAPRKEGVIKKKENKKSVSKTTPKVKAAKPKKKTPKK